MKSRVVPVPGPLLLYRRPAESAKLLWMLCQLEAEAPAAKGLESRSGLSRHTGCPT